MPLLVSHILRWWQCKSILKTLEHIEKKVPSTLFTLHGAHSYGAATALSSRLKEEPSGNKKKPSESYSTFFFCLFTLL